MNKKILNESFDINVGKFKSKTGKESQIAYIISTNGENIIDYKDIIKKYDAKWFPTLKVWGWFVSKNNQFVTENQIQPCIKELNKQSNNSNNNIINIVDKILNILDNPDLIDDLDGVKVEPKIIEDKLKEFKQQLINCVSSDEFKQLITPILKFKRAQGHNFSFLNALLIYIQFPNAVMVKSKTHWQKVNRNIIPGSKPIGLYVPIMGKKLFKDEESKKEFIKRFCKAHNVNNVNDLTPGLREKLDVELNKTIQPQSYKLMFSFYDYSQTQQMEGKEDLVGDPNVDLPWFEDGEESDETIAYINAIKNVIVKSGVKLSDVDDLGGAKGVSKSGEINVLKNATQNLGLFNTLVHEFAHELLHQKYLSNNNDELKEFFIDTKQGRGIVEQQAELTAWIVLMHFGYNLQTSINYVSMWGLDEKTAPFVFDTVTNVANKIVGLIVNELENNLLNENYNSNKLILKPLNLKPEELADMCGMGDLYRKGKEKIETEINDIQENFYKNLNKLF